MTVISLENEPTTDAELVAASSAGDRQAFGRLVRRYQGMVSGLIYAYCGDLHLSEDLAQETFLAAWRNLPALRESERLVPWLCQIARRRVMDQHRTDSREKNRVDAYRATNEPASPVQEAMTDEERELLWRILSELPQPYRETLVLYYRQNQSAAAVAEAMETTEAAVRQRLVRGRQLLREQVEAGLEKSLVRSSPGPAFAMAVLAALPAAILPAAKAATLGAAALSGGMISTLIGPFAAVVAGFMGFRQSLRDATSKRERWLVIGFGIVLAVLILAGMFGLSEVAPICRHYELSASAFLCVLAASWLVYTLVIVLVTKWVRRRQIAMRRESAGQSIESAATGARHKMPIWMTVCMTIGCTAWMIDMAWQARDTRSVVILAIATVLLIVGWTYGFRRAGRSSGTRLSASYIAIIGLMTTGMINWRFQDWMAAVRGVSLAEIQHRMPLWGMDVLLVTLFVCAELLVWASGPGKSRQG